MEIDEYLKTTEPRAQRSALEKHDQEIRKLRDAGMTLKQIVEFLLGNGVMITASSLSRFLRKARTAPPPAPVIPPSTPDYLTRQVWSSKSESSALVRPAGMTDAGWREALLAHTKRNRTK